MGATTQNAAGSAAGTMLGEKLREPSQSAAPPGVMGGEMKPTVGLVDAATAEALGAAVPGQLDNPAGATAGILTGEQ